VTPITFNAPQGVIKGPGPGPAETPVPIVNLFGPIEAETHLNLILDEQAGQVITHQGPVGLKAVIERKLWILRLEVEDGTKKFHACQQGFTTVPVNLYGLVERIDGQIMGNDAPQNRVNRGKVDNTPGMLLEAISTRQVAVPGYLDLGHHR
jgi:hypothetical protein